MLNTTGDHTKEMSIKLCQTKPAFRTESKTQKKRWNDRMEGVIKRKME
jgi:hypothetical protein